MASSLELYTAITALTPDIYWTLDEASGDAIQQGALTTGNLVFSGSYTQAATELISGDSARFLSLTGGKGTASRGNLTLPVGNCTVTFLVKIPEEPANTSAAFFSIGATGETTATNFQLLYRYSTYPDLEVFWEYGSSGTNASLPSGVQLNRGIFSGTEFEPAHVTLVKDADNKTVTTYVNGFIRETITYTTEPTGGTSASFFLGGAATAVPAETLTMSIGHFALFQRVLTAQEIVDLAKASGFMAADHQLGAPEFDVAESDAENFGTIADIKDTLEYSASKLLTIALDPLIDPSLLAGSDAYASSE